VIGLGRGQIARVLSLQGSSIDDIKPGLGHYFSGSPMLVGLGTQPSALTPRHAVALQSVSVNCPCLAGGRRHGDRPGCHRAGSKTWQKFSQTYKQKRESYPPIANASVPPAVALPSVSYF